MNPDDTIVAISSPPGSAQRGIVRISGPSTLSIAARYFRGSAQETRPQTLPAGWSDGRWSLGPSGLPVSISNFQSPHSYTGADVVEIHCLGAPVLLGMIVESCLAAGARRAEPGEFTARAMFAGRLDFSQVHGVAGMIAAQSDDQLRAARRLLHGALGRQAVAAREELADLISLVEGAMDFADEPIEFINGADLGQRLQSIHANLVATLAAGSRGQRWTELPRAVLVGRPNAGKSSLMNRLTGLDRAICTAIAGTTRDPLSAPLQLEGGECLLIDVAGIDDGPSELDRKAGAAASEAIHSADLLLHVIDAAARIDNYNAIDPERPFVLVANKCDLLDAEARDRLTRSLEKGFDRRVCLVSARTGEGCDRIIQAVGAALADRPAAVHDAAIALMAEHREALARSIEAIDRALQLATRSPDSLADADLVAAELRLAAEALGELVGQDNTEEMLGRIFARFCVGK